MKNWKYIEGTKTGNGVFSIFKSDKPIKMKSPQGAIVTINPDGTAAHQDKEGSQMAVHPHNSFKEAVEYYKSQGYVKVSNESLGEYMAKKPRVINEEKTGAEEFFKKLSDDVKEREKKDDADIEKVGNFKTGTSALKPGDRVQSYGVQGTVRKVEGENSDNIYGEPIIEVEWDNGTVKKVGEHYLRKIGNKVGNALNWDENLVGKFVWVKDKGQEWKVYVMQDKGDKVYIRDDEDDSQGWVSKTRITGKVGNSKTGNVQYHKVGKITIRLEANDDDWTVYDTNGFELKSGKGGLGRAKTWAEHFARFTNKQTGNEASDDKFAYVMREFDEGKLKTPDGKVVTDPAQAKAIAYSESKKTENGLARARNAMAKNWNSDRNINPVGAYKEFIANLKNAIELGVAAVTYNIDGSTLKTWVDQAKKEGYGSHISGIQGQKVILK